MGLPCVPIGIGPPNVFTVTVGQGASPLDLTTVTGVSLKVTKTLTGIVSTWACTIVSATAASLVAQHAFATPDVDTLGEYDVAVSLTVPYGTVPAYSFSISGTPPQQTPQNS